MNKLEEARKIINEVDAQMAELFVKRMQAAELVFEHKKEFGLPIQDPAREAVVVEKNAARIQDEVLKGYYIDYIKHLMGLSGVSVPSAGRTAGGLQRGGGRFCPHRCRPDFPGRDAYRLPGFPGRL